MCNNTLKVMSMKNKTTTVALTRDEAALIDEACRLLLKRAKALGHAISLEVRPDGRVEVETHGRQLGTNQMVRADLLPGGPLPLPGLAVERVTALVVKAVTS